MKYQQTQKFIGFSAGNQGQDRFSVNSATVPLSCKAEGFLVREVSGSFDRSQIGRIKVDRTDFVTFSYYVYLRKYGVPCIELVSDTLVFGKTFVIVMSLSFVKDEAWSKDRDVTISKIQEFADYVIALLNEIFAAMARLGLSHHEIFDKTGALIESDPVSELLALRDSLADRLGPSAAAVL